MSRAADDIPAMSAATAGPLANETVDSALQALLSEYPDAHVAAISDDGLFVAMPSSVPLGAHRVLQARTGLDLVVPEERELVLQTWERARATGAAVAQLHLRVDPERLVVMHYLDARPSHGVYLSVVVGEDGAALPDIGIPPLPPRIARVHKNELAVFTAIDEATTALLGWSAHELLGHRSLEFIHSDDQERAIGSWTQMLSEPDRVQPAVRLRHRRTDGTWAWFEVTNHNRLADQAARDVLAEMIDISDEMAAQEALQAREQLLHRLAEALPIGVFQVLADRRIAYTNERLESILGVGPAASVQAQLATVSREDWPSVEAALDAALLSGIDGDLEVQVHPSDEARTRRCLLRLRPLTNLRGAVSGAVVCVEDVTASAQLRAELERRASHDLLTRLLNRASVLAALEGALAIQGRGGTAAIFID
ncbi:MAG: PAS domain S-box protein, partial [Candidatus Limnocylindrales bacterium]